MRQVTAIGWYASTEPKDSFQGGIAAGSATWGAVATRTGLRTALVAAGLATMATIVAGAFARFPETTTDTTPWDHWRMPMIVREAKSALDHGPVLVTVRYHVRPEHGEAFVRSMEPLGRIRRRDGASWWGVLSAHGPNTFGSTGALPVAIARSRSR